MNHLKPTLLQGHYHRRPVPDLPSLLSNSHTVIPVKSQSEYTDALNRAWSDTKPSLIVLDKAGMDIGTQMIKDQTKSGEVVHFGNADNVRMHGSQWRILSLYGSDNHGFVNLTLDGREGFTRKGVVIGSSDGRNDQHRGPSHHSWFSHVKVQEVGEQLFMFADNSTHLVVREMDLVDSGIGPHGGDHAEGFYGGKGGDSEFRPRFLDIEGLYVARTRGGEGVDLKVNTTDVSMKWFEIEDVEHQYGAALTIAIDNQNGGHGQDNNVTIEDGYIHNIKSTKYSVSGIQAGAGCRVSRVLIENIPGGHGIQTLRQAVGPNKTMHATDIAIGSTGRAAIDENNSTLTDKSKANSPMTLNLGLVDRVEWPTPDHQKTTAPTLVVPAPIASPTSAGESLAESETLALVNAKGDTGTEKLQIIINGEQVAIIDLTETFMNHPVKYDKSMLPVRYLEVRYINDDGDPSIDRNVTIKSVAIAGSAFLAAEGVLVDPEQIVQNYRQDGRLYWNSSLLFPVSNEPQPTEPEKPAEIAVLPADEHQPATVQISSDMANKFGRLADIHDELADLYRDLAGQE